MTLEHQVTSLEISQRLKELEVKQESLFFWIKAVYLKGNEEWQLWSQWEIEVEGPDFGTLEDQQDYSAAFTVAELGETLSKVPLSAILEAYGWVVGAIGTQVIAPFGLILAMKNPNFAGEMLIYLFENKLIAL